jgi:hypothetical protein
MPDTDWSSVPGDARETLITNLTFVRQDAARKYQGTTGDLACVLTDAQITTSTAQSYAEVLPKKNNENTIFFEVKIVGQLAYYFIYNGLS